MNATQPTDDRVHRLILLDIFILTACCALGVAFIEWIWRGGQGESTIDALIFRAVLPCVSGGVYFGHPALLAAFTWTGRRSGKLSFGEAIGFVPAATIAVAWALSRLVSASQGVDMLDMLYLNLLFLGLPNGISAILATTYIQHQISQREPIAWTDGFGVFAAILPWTSVMLIALALWLAS